jgi:prepilin-type N-terminal cleavage/methylation domain-containing protein
MLLNFNILKSKGFTLAEVLITLLIIGVVASLVIPAIVNDTQNEELNTLLKKNYSAFVDAARLMMLDNGGNLTGVFLSELDMYNKFGNYIVFSKICPAGSTECFYAGTNTWKNLYGADGSYDHTATNTGVINNGSTVRFTYESSGCSTSHGAGSLAEFSCGYVEIDVNGYKKPNVMGRDIFFFWITKTGVYPNGIPKDVRSNWDMYCDKTSSAGNSGRGCAAKILGGGKVD